MRWRAVEDTMAKLLLTQLAYPMDAADLFAPFAEQPWAMWLDSGMREHAEARYDIMVAEPIATLVTRGSTTTLVRDGHRSTFSDDPLMRLQQVLDDYPCAGDPALPFSGGALGYFAYDLGHRYESIPEPQADDIDLPEMAVGIYAWAAVVDHVQQQAWLVGQAGIGSLAENWAQLVARFHAPAATRGGSFKASGAINRRTTRDDYTRAFGRIQHYLVEGDCYQVNYAQRFDVAVSGSPWQGYRRMRQYNPAPFAAFLNLPDGAILSASPERFLALTGTQVTTSPIKGTRPRCDDPQADNTQRQALSGSAKDRAENLMIVDLLRNDLGKVCVPGTVRVSELFAVKSFATVHHLVSTIHGELSHGRGALELLRACFPGGSITGAPKRRAMQIIAELEPLRRHLYCGSIGYIGFNGNMDSSIAIRTTLVQQGRAYYWAGGGIVIDSVCEEEYQESLDKAAAFFHWMEEAQVPSP